MRLALLIAGPAAGVSAAPASASIACRSPGNYENVAISHLRASTPAAVREWRYTSKAAIGLTASMFAPKGRLGATALHRQPPDGVLRRLDLYRKLCVFS